ncbi:putative inorganic phosphate cotransporter isoform X2 [Leptinotarsa decemlineata]
MMVMLAIAVGMRVQLSVAIVAMTTTNTSSNPDIPAYDWKNQDVILSSFYWGYIWLQIIGAELGRRFGPKNFLLGAMFVNSTAMNLIPIMAEKLGSYGVMGCRVFMGLSQGFFYANINIILSKWTPISEMARMGTLALSGAPVGTIITMPIVGYISSTSLGWPFTFYLYGGLGYAWVILYAIFGANSPQDHRSITEVEKTYIENGLDLHGNKLSTPWKSILTSLPVWAIFFVQIGSIWGYTVLISEIPTYLSKVANFNIESNGLLSASPYCCAFVLGFVFAFSSDYLINNGFMMKTRMRKMATALSTIGPAISLTILGFLPDNTPELSVAMLILTVSLQSAGTSGYIVNNLDLSPNFAGLIMALCNSSTNVLSILGPLVVQLVVTDKTDRSLWRIIFLISAALYILPNIFYSIFASGEIQPWDSEKSEIASGEVQPRDSTGIERRKVEDRSTKKMSVISIMSL